MVTMKTITVFLTIVLFGIEYKTKAQEFISSNVRVFQEAGKTISSKENEFSIIKLNSQTNQLSIDLCVLLTNTNDSLEELNQELSLNFRGAFPIDDLVFFNLAGKEGQIYTITGELTVNDIVKTYSTLNFSLHTSNFPSIYTRDVESYKYHISFLMEINPIDFCLEIVLQNCARIIFVEVKDGTINKLHEYDEKIGCEVQY